MTIHATPKARLRLRRRLALGGTSLVVLVLLFASAPSAPPAGAVPAVGYTVSQGAFGPIAVTPYDGGTTSATAFYSYEVPCLGSANTGLELAQTTQLFFYTGPGGLSLFVIHDRPESCLGELSHGGAVDFTYVGLPPGATRTLGDDTGEGFLPFSTWEWDPCCTDGAVVALPTCGFEFSIEPEFLSGIGHWVMRSGTAGETIVAFPSLTEPVTLACLLDVEIDVKPGSDSNSIRLTSRGVVPVAILGTTTFDVADVDATTLAFGPAGAVPVHSPPGHLLDVDGDGDTDLVAHFRVGDTGIAAGDTSACVTGSTTGGGSFEGCDAIRTLP